MLHYFLYGFMRLQLAYSLKRSPFHTFFPFPFHVALWEQNNNVYELEQLLRPFMHTMQWSGKGALNGEWFNFHNTFTD